MKATQRSIKTEMLLPVASIQMIPAINGMTIRNGVYLLKPFR